MLFLEAGTEAGEPQIACHVAGLPQIDLTPIRFRVTKNRSDLTAGQIDEMELRYLRFLMLCKEEPNVRHEPDKEVDLYWHTHLLYTRKYVADCQNYFGYFLHHEPNLNGEKCDDGCGSIQV